MLLVSGGLGFRALQLSSLFVDGVDLWAFH